MASPDNTFERSPFTAPGGGTTAGTPLVIQDLAVLPIETVAAAATFVGIHRSMRIIRSWPKTTAEAWAKGQKIYAIAATGLATTTVGTNKELGFAAADQLAGDTLGDVYLPS